MRSSHSYAYKWFGSAHQTYTKISTDGVWMGQRDLPTNKWLWALYSFLHRCTNSLLWLTAPLSLFLATSRPFLPSHGVYSVGGGRARMCPCFWISSNCPAMKIMKHPSVPNVHTSECWFSCNQILFKILFMCKVRTLKHDGIGWKGKNMDDSEIIFFLICSFWVR